MSVLINCFPAFSKFIVTRFPSTDWTCPIPHATQFGCRTRLPGASSDAGTGVSDAILLPDFKVLAMNPMLSLVMEICSEISNPWRIGRA